MCFIVLTIKRKINIMSVCLPLSAADKYIKKGENNMGRLFGTDGIRGIANESLTCETAMQVGRAVGSVLVQRDARSYPLVLVGADTRVSSDMLANAVIAGLCSVGADVINLGVIPTPAVAYLVGKYKARAGFVISASHNPYEFNGLKVFDENGQKLPDELEERIEEIAIDNTPKPNIVKGDRVGHVKFAANAVKDYVDHLKSTVAFSLDGMKIAVDCANGASYKTAKKLFTELGAECVMLNDSPNGVNINDRCGSTCLDTLQEYMKTHKLDAGVAFDGDADRCLCVDDNGEIVDGDMIMAIEALDMRERGKLANDAVVCTIMSNFGFLKFCKDNDIKAVMTKVGDRYVLETMLIDEHSLGGEQSGHIIFRDFATTGDGELTAIQLLSLMRRTKKKLSELAKVMKRFPQFIVNVPSSAEAKLAFYTDNVIKDTIESVKEELGSNARIVVRPSGTEPYIRVMAEGENDEVIQAAVHRVESVIRERLGQI